MNAIICEMSAAQTIQLLKDKWAEISANEELRRAFIVEAKQHTTTGGGILWIKYDSRETGTSLWWTFVPKESAMWNDIPRFVGNFESVTTDYDPEKHCLMFLSVPHGANSMYGQMVRVNYEGENSTPPTTSLPSSRGNTTEDGTWNFRLA